MHDATPDPNGRDNCLYCGQAIQYDESEHRYTRYLHLPLPPKGTFIHNANGVKYSGFNVEVGIDVTTRAPKVFIRPVLNGERLSWHLTGMHVDANLLIQAIKEAMNP